MSRVVTLNAKMCGFFLSHDIDDLTGGKEGFEKKL